MLQVPESDRLLEKKVSWTQDNALLVLQNLEKNIAFHLLYFISGKKKQNLSCKKNEQLSMFGTSVKEKSWVVFIVID